MKYYHGDGLDIEYHPRQTFLGECYGVALEPRNEEGGDLHVMFTIIAEDDGEWAMAGSGGSSHWLPELATQLKAAEDWVRANCDPHISERDGKQYGWKFRI